MNAPQPPPYQQAYAPVGPLPPPVPMPDNRVIRSVGRCIALLVLSCGFWSFAWVYHTTKEVSPRVNRPTSAAGAWMYAVPILNLVVLYWCWRDIEEYTKRARAQSFDLLLWFLLSILISFVAFYSYPMVQSRLNDAHRSATNGQAQNAPMEPLDWIMIAVGWAFVVGRLHHHRHPRRRLKQLIGGGLRLVIADISRAPRSDAEPNGSGESAQTAVDDAVDRNVRATGVGDRGTRRWPSSSAYSPSPTGTRSTRDRRGGSCRGPRRSTRAPSAPAGPPWTRGGRRRRTARRGSARACPKIALQRDLAQAAGPGEAGVAGSAKDRGAAGAAPPRRERPRQRGAPARTAGAGEGVLGVDEA